MSYPTVEECLDAFLKQPNTFVTPAERQFIVDMRKAAAAGVGYGMMQQLIEWEWNSKAPGGWGPNYFGKEIQRLEDALKKR